MSEEDKRSILYKSLALLEDYLVSGIQNQEPLPDFKPEQATSTLQQIPHEESRRNTGDESVLQNPRVREERTRSDSSGKRAIPVASIALTELAEGFKRPASDSLEKITRECGDCRACRLFANRSKAIAGKVTQNAKLIIITDSPNQEDDNESRLFSGAQGDLLSKMLEAIGLSMAGDITVFSITKCRTPDREPAPDEAMHCSPFLLRQLALINTPLILAFGRVASQGITGKTREALPALRGSVHSVELFGARKVVCTYHPREILGNSALKRPVWEDLKLLQSML